jgi:hypothetical protein
MGTNNIAVLGLFVFLVYLAATGRMKNLLLIVTQPKVTEGAPTSITSIPVGVGGGSVLGIPPPAGLPPAITNPQPPKTGPNQPTTPGGGAGGPF